MEGHEEKDHKNEGFCAPCFMEGRKDGATYELRSMIAELEIGKCCLHSRTGDILMPTNPFSDESYEDGYEAGYLQAERKADWRAGDLSDELLRCYDDLRKLEKFLEHCRQVHMLPDICCPREVEGWVADEKPYTSHHKASRP